MITQYARSENAHCEEVTTEISIAAKNASDRLVAVFVSCDDVPRCRIERYRSQRKEEGDFGRVDEGNERHDCYVVVEDRQYCSAHDTRARPKILRTLSPSRVYDTTPRHLY